VATALLFDPNLSIAPYEKNHVVVMDWKAPRDILLLSMFPHMHLRGKSFRYEAIFPTGQTETLLHVPRYDFYWQHRYEFVEPRRFPQGTIIRCTGTYDNSKENRANPDPSATVKAGKQSWDEMFNGYFDWAIADQDLVRESQLSYRLQRAACDPLNGLLIGIAALGGLWLRRRKRVSWA
jgi:hypothetical protein